MSIIQGNVLGGVEAAYQIERSLRFNSPDNTYLQRTPASSGSATTGTTSFWVKRAAPLGTDDRFIYSAAPSGHASNPDIEYIDFSSNDEIIYFLYTSSAVRWNLKTTAVYRDPSAWYHIVAVKDTNNATSSDRIRIYVNGVRVTAFATATYPSSGQAGNIGTAVQHRIGEEPHLNRYNIDGYLADFYYIDGQALDESYFGQTNATTGVWEPIEYTGTYGTTGFYLPFSDNSSTTTLGDDLSGNGNDWTTNNFSVTAGAGNDSLVDTPTPYGTDTGVGGEVRGNYCTMNPLQYSSTYAVLSNGNLNVAGASGVDAGGAFATAKVNSGKWYWEALILGVQSTYPFIGFAVNTTGAEFQGGARIGTAGTPAIVSPESFIALNGSPSGTSFTTNDVIQFALDMDNGKMWVGKNGTWMNSGVPASGTGNMFSISDTSQFVSPYIFSYNASSVAFNFGQRAFSYTAPSGFKALCTQNLPSGTVTTSGSFTGNLATDGPFVYLNGVPTAMTINGNAVTFGTHADKLANGFKVRSSSSSYNASGSNTYSVSATGEVFKNEVAQSNP